MGKTVDFFYAIGSRYSYLASSQIALFERDTGVTVRWRPLYSDALMKQHGVNPFAGPPPSGQYERAYRTRDVARWAKYYGIPVHDPDWEAIDWQRLALATVAADRLGQVLTFTRTLYDAVFGTAVAPSEDAELVRIAERSGMRGSDFKRLLDDPETARHHERNIADALAAGVFGVPSFVVDGEMFWGNDRLVLLRDYLGATA
jgi:2-hydroxychromene-2-carboxylate isomerase